MTMTLVTGVKYLNLSTAKLLGGNGKGFQSQGRLEYSVWVLNCPLLQARCGD